MGDLDLQVHVDLGSCVATSRAGHEILEPGVY